jgi:Carbohydrate-selective porin, OprB family
MIQKKLRFSSKFIGTSLFLGCAMFVYQPQSNSVHAQVRNSPNIEINQSGNFRKPNFQGYIDVAIGEPYRIEIYTPGYDSAVIVKIDGILVTGDKTGERLLCLRKCSLDRPFSVAKKFTVLEEGNLGLGRDGGRNNPNLGLVEVTFMPMVKKDTSLYPSRQSVGGSIVNSNDWALKSLAILNERFGCISGYQSPDIGRLFSRYEFAVNLNACLDKVNELLSTNLAEKIQKEDLFALQRLQEEFASELAAVKGRVDALGSNSARLESQQFSSTTKLNADGIFATEGTTKKNSSQNNLNSSNLPKKISEPTQPTPRSSPVGTGLSGESSQRFTLTTEWVDAPDLAPMITKKYRLVGIRQEPVTLENMAKPKVIIDPIPPRVPSLR